MRVLAGARALAPGAAQYSRPVTPGSRGQDELPDLKQSNLVKRSRPSLWREWLFQGDLDVRTAFLQRFDDAVPQRHSIKSFFMSRRVDADLHLDLAGIVAEP